MGPGVGMYSIVAMGTAYVNGFSPLKSISKVTL